MRKVLTVVALVACAAAGLFAAVALAGEGNGHQPPGGNNSCPPSFHEVRDQAGNVVGCEHNGDGGGNCGQNQSENGGDHGFGHEDGCETETTPTDTTPTEPHPTTPTDTTPTEPHPTTPTTTQPAPQPCPDGGPHNAGKDGQVPGSGNTNDDCDRSVPPPVTTTSAPPAGTPVTPAAVTTTTTTSTTTTTTPNAAPKAKPKPKPAPPQKQKTTPPPKKPEHVCLPLKDGTQRKWYKGGNGIAPGCYPVIMGSG